MGLFDIKPGKNSKKSKGKIKSMGLFQPIKINLNIKSKPLFQPIKMNLNSKPSKNKPFKVFEPVKITNTKTKNLIFGFDIPKKKTKAKGKRGLSWPQAKVKFPGLSPHGDADKDGVKNWLDCRPFDPMRQGSWKEETKHTKGGKWIIEKKGEKVAGPFKNKRRARNKVDKLDNDYGAYVHKIKAHPEVNQRAVGDYKKNKVKTDENPLTATPYPKTKYNQDVETINIQLESNQRNAYIGPSERIKVRKELEKERDKLENDDPVQEEITNETQWVEEEYDKIPKSKYEEEAEEYDPHDDEGYPDDPDEPSSPEPEDDANYLEHKKESDRD